MHEDLAGVRQMQDAALVRSARRQIGQALAELADRPLDEAAASAMLQALDVGRPASAALRRLSAGAARHGDRGLEPGDADMFGLTADGAA